MRILQTTQKLIKSTKPLISSKCSSLTTKLTTNSSSNLHNFQNRRMHISARSLSKEEYIPSTYDRYVFPEPPKIISEEEHDAVCDVVNTCISNSVGRRLFAVIMVSGQQFKVTQDDLVRVDGYLDADIGDRIRLEKVLLVGGSDFSLVGRPVVGRNLQKIEATVIEKTPAADKVVQKFKPRSRYDVKWIHRSKHTILRINCVEAYPEA